MTRLADYGTMDAATALEKLTDIQDKEVQVLSVRFVDGQYGEFAVIECEDEEGRLHVVSSGAMFVMDALRAAVAENALPLPAKFYRKGRYWMVE